MSSIQAQIVENVFPEERRKVFVWLNQQKRHLRSWLIVILVLFLAIVGWNIVTVVSYVYFNQQFVFNVIIPLWIITSVLTPFVWPQKPGDFFSDDFRSGINPRIWDSVGQWQSKLDEDGHIVLEVTESEMGGIAVPCLSWVDYEFQFETRIMNRVTGWIVRASNLNELVMFQLTPTLLRPHYKVIGVWPPARDLPHNLSIEVGKWISISTLVRGSWATIYITIDGTPHKVFQEQVFAQQPASPISMSPRDPATGNPITITQMVNPTFQAGSFGFRLSGGERAQFRRVRAYRLR